MFSCIFDDNFDPWFDYPCNVQTYDRKNFQNKFYRKLDKESTKGSILRTHKIEIFPNKKQKNIINSWFPIYNLCFNQSLKYIKSLLFNKEKIPTKLFLRDYIRNLLKNNQRFSTIIESSKIPAHCLDQSIFDLHKAYITCFSQIKSNIINNFNIKYKNNKIHSMVIPSECFSKIKNAFVVKILKEIKSKEPLKDINHDSRLVKYDNRYFLYVPKDFIIENIKNKKEVCSIDPGIRSFANIYDKQNYIECNPHMKNISKKYEKLNKLKKFDLNYKKEELENLKLLKEKNKELIKQCRKIKSKENKKNINNIINFNKKLIKSILPSQKNKINKSMKKLYKSIKNKVNSLHWKTITFLVKNYNTILMGNMNTKGIVKKDSIINGKTKDMAYILSNYIFKQRLKAKCEQYNTKYIEVDERYTSKTCGYCGVINKNLGSKKIFECSKEECKFTIKRDLNGARNIMIKYYELHKYM